VQPQTEYRLGSIGPTAFDLREGPGNGTQQEPLLPAYVTQVSIGLGIKDYTIEGVETAIGNYWNCIEALVSRRVQRTVQGGWPIAAQLGRARLLDILKETNERTGLFADADSEATVAAMHHLGVTRIAVASRWAGQLNEALTRFLNDAGIEVLAMTTEGQWAAEAFGMSIEQGVKLAIKLGREAMRAAPEAQGLLLPGGTWRSLAVIPCLEEDFGRPVFTNPTGAVWRLIHDGIAPPVEGWGRVLATP
jgi:hypothetical protein